MVGPSVKSVNTVMVIVAAFGNAAVLRALGSSPARLESNRNLRVGLCMTARRQ